MDWVRNAEALHKKGQSRLYFLRRLQSFNICQTMLKIFYESVVANAIVCCGVLGQQTPTDSTNWSGRPGDVIEMEMGTLTAGVNRRMLSKLRAVLENGFLPLHDVLMNHRSSFSERPLSATGSLSCPWPSNSIYYLLSLSVRLDSLKVPTFQNAQRGFSGYVCVLVFARLYLMTIQVYVFLLLFLICFDFFLLLSC